MGTLSLRIDDALDDKLTREALRDKLTRSELAREALASFLREREHQRYVDALARAARELDPTQSVALAEEALESGNDALLASEPRPRYRGARRSVSRTSRAKGGKR